MWTLDFWKDTAERALKTCAQALITTLSLATGIFDVEWQDSVSVALLMTLMSVLTSIGSTIRGDSASASLLAPGGRREA